MKTTIWLVIITVFLVYGKALAQPDTSLLAFQQLGTEDLNASEEIFTNLKVVAASRSLKDIGDLPFTIHVVTKEEIYQNGYTTLVDVLKSVPGIRVSQPGSAIEGETFLMRGLIGNQYTKILINDMPVKPSVVRGMPIGAQLPIKQAERIEIIMGPSAAIYGADASAGVINIILQETERPFYVQADLSAGFNGFNNVDVLFGGKLGKDKKVLKFNLYGSNTVLDDRRVFYNLDSLYNPVNYSRGLGNVVDSSFLSDPTNYRGSLTQPRLSTMPHLSRNFGFNLRYRNFYFSFDKMYRRDHSSIGLNPLAVAYYNPITFTGEEIIKTHLSYQKDFNRLGLKINTNYLRYQMDNRSSTIFIQNSLSRVGNGLAQQLVADPTIRDSIKNEIFEKLFSRTRFQYAESHDVFLELLLNYAFGEHVEFIAGGRANLFLGLPIVNFLPTPFEAPYDFAENYIYEGNAPIPPSGSIEGDASLFSQLYLNFDRLKAIMGIQFSTHALYGKATNPRLAVLYKLNTNLSIRGSYGTAFRAPSPFYNASTFEVEIGDLNSLSTSSLELGPETTTSYELGARWGKRKFRGDLSFFYTQTKNFISYNYDLDTEFSENQTKFTLGYFNDENSAAVLYGTQLNLEVRDIIPKHKLNAKLGLSYNEGSETLPFGLGELSNVRAQPQFLTQLNVSFKVGKRFYLGFNNVLMTKSISRRVLRAATYELNRDRFTNKGYYTLDVLGRVQFSENFQAYWKITNFFNNKYAGIDATGTIDDLEYNPQSLSIFQIGMSYRMD